LLFNERTRALSGLIDKETPKVICLIVSLPVRGKEANIFSWSPEIERFHLFVIESNDSPCGEIIVHNEVVPDWLLFTGRIDLDII
jgi:hypothetical protein